MTDNFTEQDWCDYFTELRWPDENVVSPFDPTSKVYKCKNNRYKCVNTGKYFNVKTGTVLAWSKLPFQKWAIAIDLFLLDRNISSIRMALNLGVTQKTAWRILSSIKEARRKNSGVLNSYNDIF